jgi:hypothetical protein
MTIVDCMSEMAHRESPFELNSTPVVIGSLVGPMSVPVDFGPFETRLLHGILGKAGVRTNIGATAAAVKGIRAFW